MILPTLLKKTIFCFILFSTVSAQSWSPFVERSHNFALPHYYAAKETITTWYKNLFINSLNDHDQEFITIIEDNSDKPIYCTKITTGSITTNFCNPWTLAVFIKNGHYYVTHRRYKFFSTLNHMEVLKINLNLDSYDEFYKIVLPFASSYHREQLSPSQKLALSFYYIYDYLINDNCSSDECQEKARFKKNPLLERTGEENLSFSWMHRTLLTGCSQGGSCITAREITYKVNADQPTIWFNKADDTPYVDTWKGSPVWQKLETFWVTGLDSPNSAVQIPNIPLP